MSEKTSKITRRGFITSSAAAIMGLAIGSTVGAGKSAGLIEDNPSKKGRSVRFAHFTDIHLDPNRSAPEGLTAALHHAQSLLDKPDMIITGGDNIMDSLGADDNWTEVQYKLLKKVFAKECKLPVKFCVGNHDVWGWDKKNSRTTGQEKLWGKKRVIKELGLPNSYYSFDKGRWHFILLDSTYPDDSIYTALLDEEQFNWFAHQLESFKKSHICIISHIPILSVAAFLDGENEKTGRWTLPDEWMHLDARKIKDLLGKYPNVRLCISGHLHLVDRARYNEMTYICDGAVCGAWWGGKHYECDAGYGIFDLYDDGTFDHQYISYGWIPKKESA
ncbi:MAG: metallophosphoesterase [Sedimentisphaerales bacterium]